MGGVAFLTERMRLGFGVDLMIDQLASGLARDGHDVTVFTLYDDGTYADAPYRIETVPIDPDRDALRFDARAIKLAFGAGLVDHAADIWFAATPPFFALLPFVRGPRVAIDCGVSDWTGMAPEQRRNAQVTELLQQRVWFRFATRVVTISAWLRDQLPSGLRRRTAVVHLGADHHRIASAEEGQAMRRRLGVGPDELLCLYIGRLNPEQQPYKGVNALLDAVADARARVTQVRLAMAGFGDDADAANIRAQGALALTNVPRADLPALYAAADLYVTASRWEGFDLPAVEAQHAGLPVVALRRGAHAEVVDDGFSGALVDSDAALADAIVRFADDPAARAEAGRQAMKFVQRFTWADTVARYSTLVDELTAAR